MLIGNKYQLVRQHSNAIKSMVYTTAALLPNVNRSPRTRIDAPTKSTNTCPLRADKGIHLSVIILILDFLYNFFLGEFLYLECPLR